MDDVENDKGFEFLFIDDIKQPFEVNPESLLDPKKYEEVTKNNEVIKIENEKIIKKCNLLKDELQKIRVITQKIKEKVKKDS